MQLKATSILLIILVLTGLCLSVAGYRFSQNTTKYRAWSFLGSDQIKELSWVELHDYTWVIVPESPDGSMSWAVGLRESVGAEYTDRIRVRAHRGEAEEYAVIPGTEILVEGGIYTVAEVRPWVGLMSESSGDPRINVAISEDEENPWVENQLLGNGEWLHTGSLGIWFVWHDSEVDHRAFLEDDGLLSHDRRWGVRDGNRVHWFTSLEPGTGVERDDGAVVTLLGDVTEFLGNGELSITLVLEVVKDGVAQRQRIERSTGEAQSDEDFYYFDPGTSEWVVVFSSLRDGEADYILFHHGERIGDGQITQGESVEEGDFDFQIRIDQVLKACVEVRLGQSGFREVVLDGENRVLRVRQGASERVGDTELQYIRGEPVFESFQGILARSDDVTSFALSPGESLEVEGDWLWLESNENGVRLVAPAEGLTRQFFWIPGVLAGLCLILLLAKYRR